VCHNCWDSHKSLNFIYHTDKLPFDSRLCQSCHTCTKPHNDIRPIERKERLNRLGSVPDHQHRCWSQGVSDEAARLISNNLIDIELKCFRDQEKKMSCKSKPWWYCTKLIVLFSPGYTRTVIYLLISSDETLYKHMFEVAIRHPPYAT